MKFESDIVIGLEIHTELNTKSKLFCGCERHTEENKPNSRCCPVCLGMPGSKPVLNKAAIEKAIKLCLALGCEIDKELVFSRKSYFYPDLAKNYQISQYELPLGKGGFVVLEDKSKVALTRIHLEEDPAALIHIGGGHSGVLIDYNRSGNPLCEVVTEPVITSASGAREFMKQLITVLSYLEIFEQDSCIIKADANISVKESGYTRVEIKNITGFKEIERALSYEILRQKHDITEGKKIVNETRGWDSEKGESYSMRTKESEDDYGYIIDPDLTITEITDDLIEKIKSKMPELATEKLDKFLNEHNLEETTAGVIAKDKDLALMYEKVAKSVDPLLASKWIRRELARVLNYQKKKLNESGITPDHLIALLKLILEKKITEKTGQQIINKLGESTFDVNEYVKNNNLLTVGSDEEIKKICEEAVACAKEAVTEYKEGNKKSINFIVGIVMKKTRGRARPDVVLNFIKKIIDSN